MNKMFAFMRESSTARFFIPIGIVLIIFGVIMFVINNNNQNYIEIEATISNVEIHEESNIDADGINSTTEIYNVDVKYTVNDKEYEEKLENVSKHNIGDKIKIYYNPSDPSQITQTKSLILPLIIIVLGLVSTTFGMISLVNALKKYQKMKEQERSFKNA